MAETYRGRRIKFDNIAVGSVTGAERHIAGGGGESTTPYGGTAENYRSVCDSSYVARAEERPLRTVCGDPTTAQTNA